MRAALYSLLLVQLILLLIAGFYRGQYINGFDGTGYYAWPRSLILDGDINFKNEFTLYNPNDSAPDPDHVYPKTKLTRNQYSAGFPFLCTPGFLIGQSFTKIFPSWRDDGYGWAPQIGYVTNSFLWYSIGILILFRFLSKRFASRQAFILTIFTMFGTSAGYYAWSEPFYAQAVEFFSVMLWLNWVFSSSKEKQKDFIFGGLILALMIWVRLDNAIFALLIFHIKKDFQRFGLASILLFAAALIIGRLPHQILRIWISGEFSLVGGYGPSDNIVHGHTFSNLLNPNLHKVLFATNNGLIFWCPLLFFGIFGLIHFFQKHSTALVVAILLKIYLVSSWLAWDGSASMGPRTLTGILPGLIWIIAVEINRAKWVKRSATALMLVSCVWFTGLVYQRFANQLPYYENFPQLRDYPYQRVFLNQLSNVKHLLTDPKETLLKMTDEGSL